MTDHEDQRGFLENLNVFSLQGLEDIRRRPDILGRIRFDVTPAMIMEPRVGVAEQRDISGYVFYIEAFEDPPALMLMKVGRGGVISTAGKIDEMPAHLLRTAVENPPGPPANQMYPITDEIRKWLEGKLDI